MEPPPAIRRLELRLADEDDHGSSYPDHLQSFREPSGKNSVSGPSTPVMIPRPVVANASEAARILASKQLGEPLSRITIPERLSEQLLRLLSKLPSLGKSGADDNHQTRPRGRYSFAGFQAALANSRPRWIPRLLAFSARTEGLDRILRVLLYALRLFGGLRQRNPGPIQTFDLLRLAECISDARTAMRLFGGFSAYEALTTAGPLKRLSDQQRQPSDNNTGKIPYRNNRSRRGFSPARSEDTRTHLETLTSSDDESTTSEDEGYSDTSNDDDDEGYDPPISYSQRKNTGSLLIEDMSSDSDSKAKAFATYGNPKLSKRTGPVWGHSTKTIKRERVSKSSDTRDGRYNRRNQTPIPPLQQGLKDMFHSPDSFLRTLRAWQNISLLFYYPLDQLYFLYKHRILFDPDATLKTKNSRNSTTPSPRTERYQKWSNSAWLSYLLLDLIAVARSLSAVAESMAVVKRQSNLVRHKTRWSIESLMGEAIDFGYSGGLYRVASVASSAIGAGLSSLGGLHPFLKRSEVPSLPRPDDSAFHDRSQRIPAFSAPIEIPPIENTEEHRMLMDEMNSLYAELRILGLRALSLCGDIPLAVNGITPSHPLPMWTVGFLGTLSSVATLVLRWEYMMGPPPS
ncbi:hypothetical protein HDU97_003832 [Phlyctochytrium planicorne]|nr:hypothetical protein HDU97_003832 [Phlyctochytrium planicorne]